MSNSKFTRILNRLSKLPWHLSNPLMLRLIYDKDCMDRFNSLSKNYRTYLQSLAKFVEDRNSYACNEGKYPWEKHIATLSVVFSEKLPADFLRNPIISSTMVAQDQPGMIKKKTSLIESVWSEKQVASVLREDFAGKPKIANFKYLTSGNRIHHACHLASYEKAMGRSFASSDSIVEWGGGYGDMARLIKRLNPGCTYTIIDLPEMCTVQYIYLMSLLGDGVKLCTPDNNNIAAGQINIVPVNSVLEKDIDIRGDSFISTWAITESPVESQQFVCEQGFFGADPMLLAYNSDSENYVKDHLPGDNLKTEQIWFLKTMHNYCFR